MLWLESELRKSKANPSNHKLNLGKVSRCTPYWACSSEVLAYYYLTSYLPMNALASPKHFSNGWWLCPGFYTMLGSLWTLAQGPLVVRLWFMLTRGEHTTPFSGGLVKGELYPQRGRDKRAKTDTGKSQRPCSVTFFYHSYLLNTYYVPGPTVVVPFRRQITGDLSRAVVRKLNQGVSGPTYIRFH